jgi:hypothetical protein
LGAGCHSPRLYLRAATPPEVAAPTSQVLGNKRSHPRPDCVQLGVQHFSQSRLPTPRPSRRFAAVMRLPSGQLLLLCHTSTRVGGLPSGVLVWYSVLDVFSLERSSDLKQNVRATYDSNWYVACRTARPPLSATRMFELSFFGSVSSHRSLESQLPAQCCCVWGVGIFATRRSGGMTGIQAPYPGVWYGALSAGSNAVPPPICSGLECPSSGFRKSRSARSEARRMPREI